MSYMRNEQNIHSQWVYYCTELKSYLTKVYNYMALALGVTGLVVFLMVFSDLYQVIHSKPVLSLVIIFSPAAFVIYMRYKIQHLSAQSAVTMFFSLSVLMGISLSYILIV